MSELITIRAYKFAELSDKAKDRFVNEMWDMPFETETEKSDAYGNIIIDLDYFGEWDLEDQIDYCESNNYLFNKYGELVGHLEECNKNLLQECKDSFEYIVSNDVWPMIEEGSSAKVLIKEIEEVLGE
jgi:hypothetical protein